MAVFLSDAEWWCCGHRRYIAYRFQHFNCQNFLWVSSIETPLSGLLFRLSIEEPLTMKLSSVRAVLVIPAELRTLTDTPQILTSGFSNEETVVLACPSGAALFRINITVSVHPASA